MAAATLGVKGTAGFVPPDKGVFGGVVSVTANLNSGTNLPVADRSNLKLQIFHFTSVANTNTWTSNIKNIVAVAWQPEDATDDDVRPALTTQATGVVTFVAGGTRAGWLWVLSGANSSR